MELLIPTLLESKVQKSEELLLLLQLAVKWFLMCGLKGWGEKRSRFLSVQRSSCFLVSCEDEHHSDKQSHTGLLLVIINS